MTTVSLGISLTANAPNPPLCDGRTSKYSVTNSGSVLGFGEGGGEEGGGEEGGEEEEEEEEEAEVGEISERAGFD
jgi:hypothetical protein